MSGGRVIAIHRDPQTGRSYAGPPVRDDRFFPVVEWVRSTGQFGEPFLVPIRFTENHDQAEDVKRSLYNAARYYCSCGLRNCARQWSNVPNEANPDGGCPTGGQRVSVQARLVRHEGHIRVEFKFFDKREAMREVVAKYGPDPSTWPYQARARKLRRAP